MNEEIALEIVEKIFEKVFKECNEMTLEMIKEKLAFDVKLPKQVQDATTGEVTWANSAQNEKYITNANMEKWDEEKGWMLPKQEVKDLAQIVEIWKTINYTTTERVYDSIDVAKSDTTYGCEKIYYSTGCMATKNAVFSDSCVNSDFLLASQRSNRCNFCIRTDDSKDCSNCYNVICSNKISNSWFVQDGFDLHECMFCAHIASKRFCIANMQFEEDEYRRIRKVVEEWIRNELRG